MKKLFVLGDMHFSGRRDWDHESFKNFINWFKNYEFGKYEDCELLQLGDVTEKAQNYGDTYALATEFFLCALSKFCKIYVIGGNHCEKYDTEKNKEYFSTEFLTELSNNIKTIYKEEVFSVLGGKLSVLALPYKYTAIPLDDYYNTKLPQDIYDDHYEIICGHEMIYDENFKIAGGIDLKKFNYDHAVFGHIHNRFGNNASMYTGSIMPFRKSEEKTELPRCIKVYSEDNIELPEIVLPIFRQYHVVDFRQKNPILYKKHSGQTVHVYEFINCVNDTIAFNKYPNVYVKKSTAVSIDDIDIDIDDENFDKNILLEDDFTILEQMCKEQGINLKRKTKALLKELLTKNERK